MKALLMALVAALPAAAAPPRAAMAPAPVGVVFTDGLVMHELDLRTGALDSWFGGAGRTERSTLQDHGGGRWVATDARAPWQRLTLRQGPRGWQACWTAPQAPCMPAQAGPSGEPWRALSAADVLRLNGHLVLGFDHEEARLDLQAGTARWAHRLMPVTDRVEPWDLRDDGALVLRFANQAPWVLHLEARGSAWRVCERSAKWTCYRALLTPLNPPAGIETTR